MISTMTFRGAVIRYDSDVLPEMEPRLFEPDEGRAQGWHRGTFDGRNPAHVLHYRGCDMVLRHFWRGGLIGRVSRDFFLRTGIANSRAMREFDLLAWMRARGLPVPRPLAARFVPAGLGYRADLITGQIAGAQPLADVLARSAIPASDWSGIGRLVGRMHLLGVDHTDLNCRNILVDGDLRGWLIDFDKCSRRAPGTWAQRNLARLNRSFEKERRRHPGMHWDDGDWAAFLAGYEAQTGAGAGPGTS